MSCKSSGAMPLVVGIPLILMGALSVLAGIFGNSIINTPGTNGLDVVVSALAAIAGVFVIKLGSTFNAWVTGALAIVLLAYAGFSVDGERAYLMAESTVNGAKAAALAAGQVANSSQVDVSNSSSIPTGWRALTLNEHEWCRTNPKGKESQSCQLGICEKAKCGEEGK